MACFGPLHLGQFCVDFLDPRLGLEARLLELDGLQLKRPHLPDALARADAGRQIDDLLEDIAERQQLIENSPAVTLQDAAVKLRRLSAYVDRGHQARLLGSALAAVESAVERSGCHRYSPHDRTNR